MINGGETIALTVPLRLSVTFDGAANKYPDIYTRRGVSADTRARGTEREIDLYFSLYREPILFLVRAIRLALFRRGLDRVSRLE